MKGRVLAGIAFSAASLVVLALTVSPAQAEPTAPSAGTPAAMRQLQEQGERQCVQPPAQLNMKTLSDAQLAEYGLPGRPVLASDPALWSRLLAHYHHRSCGTRPAPAGPSYRFTTGYGQNWAGNWAYGSRGTFKGASGTFTIPSVTCCETYAVASFWAGVGGQELHTSPVALVQAGVTTEIMPTYRLNYGWYEVVNPSCDLNHCKPIDLNVPDMYPGDSVSAVVSSNYDGDGYDYFAVCNNTWGYCESAYDYTTDDFSDSATGECIGEEPGVADNLYADFGTEEVSDCLLNDNGQSEAVGSVTHNYSYLNSYLDSSGDLVPLGFTLVAVGSIANDGQNYPLHYCGAAGSGNSC